MTDRGHAAIELALGVAVLILPVIVVVLAFGPWSERRVFAEASAAEVSRLAVVELDLRAASRLMELRASSYGLEPAHWRLGWCGSKPVSQPGDFGFCPFARSRSVSARVEVWVPVVSTPWGQVGGVWVAAEHSEPIDLYRSIP